MSAAGRFCKNTSLHGFADMWEAGTKGRLFWAAMLLGFSAICTFQVVKLGISFYKNDVGTTTKAIMPDSMPGAIVCPVDWMKFKDEDDTAKNEALKMQKYLYGYLPMFMSNFLMASSASLDTPEWDSFEAESGWVASNASTGHGLRKIMLDEVDKITEATDAIGGLSLLIPHMASLKKKTQLNWHGPCIRYETKESVSKLQMQLAGMVVFSYLPEENKQNHTARFLFSLAGDLDPNPMVFSKFEVLEYGFDYTVKFSPLIIKRHNRRFEPCRKWTMSDRFSCMVRAGNELCRKGIKASRIDAGDAFVGEAPCITYVPPTPAYPTEESGYRICNLFDLPGPAQVQRLCVMDTLGADEGQWDEKCPLPCDEELFQFTYQKLRRQDGKGSRATVVTLQAEAGGGTMVKEYFIVTTMGLFSGIGGTMGLWLGASLLSVVQAIYLFVYQRTGVEEKSAEDKKPVS